MLSSASTTVQTFFLRTSADDTEFEMSLAVGPYTKKEKVTLVFAKSDSGQGTFDDGLTLNERDTVFFLPRST